MIEYFLGAPDKLFTTLAIIAAAGFFGWKIFAGWLIINLELDIQPVRQTKNETEDWLSILLILKKGPTDGLWLKDVVVRIYDSNKQLLEEIKDIQEYYNVAITNNKLDWSKQPKNKRKYTIAPNEIFRYGIVREIKAGSPVIIEGAVYGKRPFWQKGFQWRASVISLPVSKKTKEDSA
ncbi:MAG: hypothetical protein JNL23_10760 [Chitinophagaceae bacterium]|nr:hypothetical protein [Chitinophagaceae bacterium]